MNLCTKTTATCGPAALFELSVKFGCLFWCLGVQKEGNGAGCSYWNDILFTYLSMLAFRKLSWTIYITSFIQIWLICAMELRKELCSRLRNLWEADLLRFLIGKPIKCFECIMTLLNTIIMMITYYIRRKCGWLKSVTL